MKIRRIAVVSGFVLSVVVFGVRNAPAQTAIPRCDGTNAPNCYQIDPDPPVVSVYPIAPPVAVRTVPVFTG